MAPKLPVFPHPYPYGDDNRVGAIRGSRSIASDDSILDVDKQTWLIKTGCPKIVVVLLFCFGWKFGSGCHSQSMIEISRLPNTKAAVSGFASTSFINADMLKKLENFAKLGHFFFFLS